jgi:alpha-amylase
MTQNIVIYLVLHQPRRLRLPAFPIPIGANPADMARALFDERMNQRYFEKAAQTSYRPTVALLRQFTTRVVETGATIMDNES